MADDQARPWIDVDLSVHTVRIGKVVLVIVNELDVVFWRNVAIQPDRREPSDVLSRILKLIIQAIIVVVRADAASERAIFLYRVGDQAQAALDRWVWRSRKTL